MAEYFVLSRFLGYSNELKLCGRADGTGNFWQLAQADHTASLLVQRQKITQRIHCSLEGLETCNTFRLFVSQSHVTWDWQNSHHVVNPVQTCTFIN